ncbi:MAG TPA: hypothetical protein VFF70_10010, partial [Anaerolineae bacterium]|nr:hypothetical protein [Anaerolineae bacterium]
ALGFVVLIFGVLPGLFLGAVGLSRKLSKATESLKKTFIAYAYVLVPLGLMAWIAFSISFVFTNFSYAWSTASDPLGAGWNLLGTAQIVWTPYITQSIPLLQASVLLIGLGWSSVTARRIANETQSGRSAMLPALPVVGYCFVITIGLMGLLIG